MSARAKPGLAPTAGSHAADAFAGLWAEPVPALKPLGTARVIHTWEGPADLWTRQEPCAKNSQSASLPADRAAAPAPKAPLAEKPGWRTFWRR